MYEKKFKDGDISIVELNKVRLNASVAEAELQRAKADRHAAGQTLPVSFREEKLLFF